MLKKRSYSILFIIITALQTVLLYFHMESKTSFCTDEVYTYSLANSPNGMYFFPKIFNKKSSLDIQDKWIDGKFFKDYICVSSNDKFNYRKVYENQLQETHPPLYYYIIHTICSFFPNTFSKWYGLGLNLFLFFIIQFLLFNICKVIFKQSRYALCICIFYGFSIASIDNFTYIGNISLLTLFNLLILNVFLKCLNNNYSLYRYIEIILIIILGSLTHYLFMLYTILLVAVFVLINIIKRELYIYNVRIILSTIFGYIWVYLLFPDIINQLLYSVYIQEIVLGIDNLIPNIGVFSYIIRKTLGISFPYYFYLGTFLFIVCCINFLIHFLNRISFCKINKYILYLSVIPVFVACILISFGINYNFKEINPLKYYLSFFPVISILLFVLLRQLNKIYFISIIIIISVISPTFVIHQILKNTNNQYFSINKILKDNNVFFCFSKEDNIQEFVPYFALCKKVLLIDYNIKDSLEFNKKNFNNLDKFYVIAKSNFSLNSFFDNRVVSNFLSVNKVNIYEFKNYK